MTTAAPTVSSAAARAICEAMIASGRDPVPALVASGVSPADVGGGRRIPAGASMRLWSEAVSRTGDRLLPVRVAGRVPFGAHGVLDHLVVASATPGDALARVARHFGLINDSSVIRWERDRRGAVLELADGHQDLPGFYAEYVFASITRRTRACAAPSWAPDEVRFAFAPPPHARALERLFRCRMRYGCEAHRMRIGAKELVVAQPFADSELCAFLDRRTARMAEDRDRLGAFAAEVRDAVRRIGSARASLPRLAAELAVSPRSVQRLLLGAGTSFRAIVDSIRRDAVMEVLADGETGGQRLARAAGLSSARALARAFRRWTGTTPVAFGATMARPVHRSGAAGLPVSAILSP